MDPFGKLATPEILLFSLSCWDFGTGISVLDFLCLSEPIHVVDKASAWFQGNLNVGFD